MLTDSYSNDLIEKVESILPIIKQGAEASERCGTLQQNVLQAILQQRLFRLFIPQQYRGEACDLPTALKAFELVASADGATGWLVMIGAGGGLFSGFLEEAAARTIFEPENAVIAGSGTPSGIATTLDSGYAVTGRWAYASGSNYATWFTANCQVDGNSDAIRAIAVPAAQVQIHNTWDVFGMKATASHDFSIDGVKVDQAYSFSLAEAPLVDEPIFYCSLETVASLSFASVALGIAQHAVDEFIDFAEHKQRAGSDLPLMTSSEVQQRCQQAQQWVSDARNQLYLLAQQVWCQAERRQPIAEPLNTEVNRTTIDIVQSCVKAADLLKASAGMMAVFATSPFGRAWRDLHTLSQHYIVRPIA